MTTMTAQLVEPRSEPLDLMGPTIQFLVPPADGEPCVMYGAIPPGAVVPLHSHADPETFLMIAGELEGFGDGRWVRVGPGDVYHVPGNVKHAWRNRFDETAIMYLVSTATIGRFFLEVAGKSAEEFLAISERYGYWNATPEENAAIGITP
jgi:quercetin dioxygenase-like cupin family protein